MGSANTFHLADSSAPQEALLSCGLHLAWIHPVVAVTLTASRFVLGDEAAVPGCPANHTGVSRCQCWPDSGTTDSSTRPVPGRSSPVRGAPFRTTYYRT